MRDIRSYHEDELRLLRDRAVDFAKRYPKIGSRLQLGNDVGDDPHVERLVQSFAFLTSRIHKRLDDEFSLFTESLLEVLYPHYLRPFPACSIASFELGPGASQMTQPVWVPRGTSLRTRPLRGVVCKFRTTFDVSLQPLKVASARYRGSVGAPAGSPVPRVATGVLSIRLELTSREATWASLAERPLRLYLAGESSQVSALREALCGRVLATLVQLTPVGPWLAGGDALPRAVGFADDEALIDFDARSHPAYRLLTEYFAFPEKFNFIDLPFPAALVGSTVREATLHYALAGLASHSDEARSLETVSENNLLPGCTPVVNLFSQRADPISVSHASTSYSVLPDGRRAFGHEVYSIDRVWRVQQTPQGESIHAFRPFYSLDHDELLSDGESPGRYWVAHRDDTLAESSPGYETEISIVDVDFDPAMPQTDTLSLQVTATNRDLPSLLSTGMTGGDLILEGGSVAREIRLLRKPTQTHRFGRGPGALWRLISHLSLNHLSLSAGGLGALKEMLRLYDLPRSAANRRMVDGLVAIEFKAASACLPGNPFATFVRGLEVRLTVDEKNFVGTGLRLFAQVLDHFFALYVHANSFTQLALVSSRSGEELIVCPRRSGDVQVL